MFLQYDRGGIEPHIYSVLDVDGIAHDVIPYPVDGKQFVRTVCAAWRQMWLHSPLAKLKFAKLQPVTCFMCLMGEDCVDMPQFSLL